MFHRALLVVLILLLPLKVAAGGVVSLLGIPGHAHAVQAGDDASPQPAHAEHAGCAFASDDAPAPLHDHACPHFGMVSLVAVAVATGPARVAGTAPAAPLPPMASVFLDVPSPIPLPRSAR